MKTNLPDLFTAPKDANKNLLPADGIVQYFGQIMPTSDADAFYNKLLHNIDWRKDEAMMFGKKIITKRKVGWYGTKAFEYTYSKITKLALPFTTELLQLQQLAEQISGHTYNSCLLNLYHDGAEGMGWHSDDEKDLLHHGAIASLSFGADRKFCFKHKVIGNRIDVHLENGSLLMMKGATQQHWLHRLPPTTKVSEPRINLTFRTIVE
jgi:alkylated DNA repair dioxygenase AlkB